ncbi:MAG: DUF1697 domain-containing protein [Ignavibacteria bacterium]|nr:DUF1697 domain-containing protein [Ignavibacteria bacterium]
MTTCIALLRGINVGGKHSLPMKTLAAILEDLGAKSVRTYIQSGNAVFHFAEKNTSKLAKLLAEEIHKRQGFEPAVLILTREALVKAMAANPFPEAEADATGLHLGFLASVPKSPNLEKLESLRGASERFQLLGSVFYLHAPDGVGRSKLAAASEKLLGVPMTDRNWRTVYALRDMAVE